MNPARGSSHATVTPHTKPGTWGIKAMLLRCASPKWRRFPNFPLKLLQLVVGISSPPKGKFDSSQAAGLNGTGVFSRAKSKRQVWRINFLHLLRAQKPIILAFMSGCLMLSKKLCNILQSAFHGKVNWTIAFLVSYNRCPCFCENFYDGNSFRLYSIVKSAVSAEIL
jgi:hypothetical protein